MKNMPGFTAEASLFKSRNVYAIHGVRAPGAPAVRPAADAGGGCTAEGFFGHETDCKKFYRCVDMGQGLVKFDFECGPGTVFDEDRTVCNHPWAINPSHRCYNVTA